MDDSQTQVEPIPSWQLYGEQNAFPDVLHCEKITDRAAGLDWVIRPHRHAHLHQFFLIRIGEVEMHVDGKTLRPKAPCVMSIPRGTVHGFTFSANTDGYVVTIPVQNLPEVFDAQSPMAIGLSRFAILRADVKLAGLFDVLHSENQTLKRFRTTLLRAYATALAVQVARNIPADPGHDSKSQNQIYRHFEDMVLKRFKDAWKLKDYAEALGVSTRHLGRLCHAATGQSPTLYIENVRMREAGRLLVYTRDSISTIGYQLGFDDPAYFSRVFRRHWGASPSVYRAQFERE